MGHDTFKYAPRAGWSNSEDVRARELALLAFGNALDNGDIDLRSTESLTLEHVALALPHAGAATNKEIRE
jgi:hypothetical protein